MIIPLGSGTSSTLNRGSQVCLLETVSLNVFKSLFKDTSSNTLIIE